MMIDENGRQTQNIGDLTM